MQKIDTALNRTLERLSARAKKHRENKIVQLPLWSEAKRGIPNSLVRSALFSAIQGKGRRYIDEEIIYAQKGITIKFTGKQLNQEDLTLWETLVHMARKHPLGDECDFTAYAILKSQNLPINHGSYKRLHSGIVRLKACAVEIEYDEKEYMGSLIEEVAKEKNTKYYVIRLNKNLISLFSETQFTAIDWQQRLELRGKPLAMFLHAFYSSHAVPFPMKLETLRQMSGSRSKQPADFKRKIKAALDDLVKIGFLSGYEIDGNIVTVKRMFALPEK